MILYEYPFNERIRTYLRLERLFNQLAQLTPRETAIDHHFALVTLFDIIEVAGKSDLKADALKDLQKRKAQLLSYRGNPAISETSLNAVLTRLETVFKQLNEQQGKPGRDLTQNDWLMALRSRIAIPGGTCEFDLPSYHAWLHKRGELRRKQLQEWSHSLVPIAQSVGLLMHLLRDGGKPTVMMAANGQYQTSLPAERGVKMLRLRLDDSFGLIPEISGNHLAISIRMMRHAPDDGKLHADKRDAPFELTFCS